MTEMIERVAKRMRDTLIPGSAIVSAQYVMSAELIQRLARAAIEAMREPTEAMTDKGRDAIVDYDREWGGSHDAAAQSWKDMIDEALK